MPYMAIDLMKPSEPVEHRLSHDLESLCMVLIHIVRFTCGPAGTSVGAIKTSHRVSQWHHEENVTFLKDAKKLDLKEIFDNPGDYISDYWAPITPYISSLLNTVYPGLETLDMNSRELDSGAFKSILINARNHCATLSEPAANYAAFNPPAVPSARKRSRSTSNPQDRPQLKHARPSAEMTLRRAPPRKARVVSFSEREASAGGATRADK